MKSYIKAISYHLPEQVLTNDELAREFPDFKIDDLTRLTGGEEEAYCCRW